MWHWYSTSTDCAVTWLSHHPGCTPMKSTWTPVMLLILVWPACSVCKLPALLEFHWKVWNLGGILSAIHNFLYKCQCFQMCLWRVYAYALLCCNRSTTAWRVSSCRWWNWDKHIRIKTALQLCWVRPKVSGIWAHISRCSLCNLSGKLALLKWLTACSICRPNLLWH